MTVHLDTQATEKLHHFAALLLRWNTNLNLIATRDEPVVWDRHIVDSLQLLPLLPPDADRGIDLGTGGGFPGLVLAIAAGLPFDLVESDQRKASFLRTAVRETGAPATVHACRIEAADIRPARLVTSRALAPLPRLLPLAARLLTDDGTGIFPKGIRAADELRDAATSWDMDVGMVPSRAIGGGTILRITGLRRKTGT